ncbi:4Fe-4S binding protein [Helicobacter pylori]
MGRLFCKTLCPLTTITAWKKCA